MWVALATVCASLCAAALRAHRSLAPALASHAHPPRPEAQTLPSPPYLRLYARRLCSAAALCAHCKYPRLKERRPKYRPRHRPVVCTVSVPIPIRNERSRDTDTTEKPIIAECFMVCRVPTIEHLATTPFNECK